MVCRLRLVLFRIATLKGIPIFGGKLAKGVTNRMFHSLGPPVSTQTRSVHYNNTVHISEWQ
jgi:hypothetical protein